MYSKNVLLLYFVTKLIHPFAGPHTISLPWKYQIGSAGTELEGCLTKLADAENTGNGEVSLYYVDQSSFCNDKHETKYKVDDSSDSDSDFLK